MIVAVYASQSHTHLQTRLALQCMEMNLHVLTYSDNWLRQHVMYPSHRDIFDAPRGGGYWAWKPLVLLDALEKYPLQTILYLDASTVLSADPTELMEEQTFATVQTGFNNAAYTKRDCFYYMNCDNDVYYRANQVWAGIVAVRKPAEDVIWEWAKFCLDRRCVTDDPSVCGLPEIEGYLGDHRHDQSILSNLVVKYDLNTLDTQLFIDT